MLHFDTIIIGAGISGMTASIYLKRANKNILILEKAIAGGQLNKTSKIENYPGFKSIDGIDLAKNVFDQIKSLDINYKAENVLAIEKENNEYTIKTNKDIYQTKSIILATGRKPKYLGLGNEKKLVGNGISFCATCDGYFFKGEDVAVIGGGNSALEEALFLSEICKKVYIIHRRDFFKADQILQEKIKEKSNILVKYNSEITQIIEEENKVSGILIQHNQSQEKLNIKGLFIYIGSDPDTDVLSDLGIDLEDKYIIVNQNMETSIKGVYACGDAIKKDIYQISTAIGEATTAAIHTIQYLKNN